jgi:hypothetical protein
MQGTSLAQRIAPLFGALYVTIGVLGFFVTGFDNFLANTGDKLLIFHINPMHNLVHLTIGAFLLAMSSSKLSPANTEGAVMGVGLFYVTAFVIGTIAKDNLTIISMSGYGDLENLNHLVNGVALLSLGLISSGQTHTRMKREGIA